MEPARDPEHRPIPESDRPVETDLPACAEPDAEVAIAYAAWRLDRRESRR